MVHHVVSVRWDHPQVPRPPNLRPHPYGRPEDQITESILSPLSAPQAPRIAKIIQNELSQGNKTTCYNPDMDMPKLHGNQWQQYFKAELQKAASTGGLMWQVKMGDLGDGQVIEEDLAEKAHCGIKRVTPHDCQVILQQFKGQYMGAVHRKA